MARVQIIESDSSFLMAKGLLHNNQVLTYKTVRNGKVVCRAILAGGDPMDIGDQSQIAQAVDNAVTYQRLLPDPTQDMQGKAAVYIGPSNSIYKKGHIYMVIYYGGGYVWQDVTTFSTILEGAHDQPCLAFTPPAPSGNTTLQLTFFRAPVGILTDTGNYYPVQKTFVTMDYINKKVFLDVSPFLSYQNISSSATQQQMNLMTWYCLFTGGYDASDAQSLDLNRYYNKTDIDTLLSSKANAAVLTSYCTVASVSTISSALNSNITSLNSKFNSYYTKQQMDSTVGSLQSNTAVISGAITSCYTSAQVDAILQSAGVPIVFATTQPQSAISDTVYLPISSGAKVYYSNNWNPINRFYVNQKVNSTFTISSGQFARNTHILSGGTVQMWGRAKDTFVTRAGLLRVFGTAIGIEATQEPDSIAVQVAVSSGGTALQVKVNHYGLVDIYGYASNIVVKGSQGAFRAYTSGSAHSILVSSGGVAAAALGGQLHSVTISSGGTVRVSDQGQIHSVTISSGGMLLAYTGGYGANITLDSGADILYYVDDTSGYIILKGDSAGSAFNLSRSFSSGFTLSGANHQMNIQATISATSVYNGGQVQVLSGGTAVNMTNSRGSVFVNPAGRLETASVEGQAGTASGLIVIRGGSATSLTISSGGKVIVSSGGYVSGLTVYDGGTYVSASGCIIDGLVDSRTS